MNPIDGESVFQIFDLKNIGSFIGFLEWLLKKFPVLDICLVVDNATYHKSKMVKEWPAKNPKVHLIYLPPKSPQLNPIEHIWRWLKGEVAANRTCMDLEQLKRGCIGKLSSLTSDGTLRIAGLKS